jgi:soluble lytic murein transglycosylase
MKITYQRVIAFFLLIALSVGFGFAFDGVATAIEKKQYPRPTALEAAVAENARTFGLPEPVLWAAILTESNFVSSAVGENGAVGLMQLTPEQFAHICTQVLGEEQMDDGMLYDPATNLRCGAAWISQLYQRYGVWETVFAAYHTGTEQVDAWLSDSTLVTPQGTLLIPDTATKKQVARMVKAVEQYSQLYYQA